MVECLDGFLKRDSARGKSANTSLPKPSRGFRRDLPMLYGVLAGEESPVPADWSAARDLLPKDVALGIRLRWQECVAWKAVGTELASLMGEEMLHCDIRTTFEAIGRTVHELHEALQAIAGPSTLPLPEEKHIANARAFVDWDALKPPASTPPVGSNNGRGWMKPEELAELEALEAQLAAELRAQKK